MAKRKPQGEAHVRIYWYEMKTPAWETLTVDARALLVELRGLYRASQGNIVFLSMREAMDRLSIGQRRIQAAFASLIERGWISIAEKGSFHLKSRHATCYRLENQASAAPGAEPSKAYMKWSPTEGEKKSR
jgi:hypothetical protein